jgi:hypothetical protein
MYWPHQSRRCNWKSVLMLLQACAVL